jgi:transcriptional regulator with XRE-family HTH domain
MFRSEPRRRHIKKTNMPGRHNRNLIGPRLREMRMKRHFTQRALADKLRDLGCRQVTRSWVSKVESRQVAVNDYHLILLAKTLNIQLTELLAPLARQAAEIGKKHRN